MRSEVLREILSESLLRPGDTVVCAVSGGADSMAMLWCLFGLKDRLSVSLRVLHCNHRLRGAASDEDEAFVRQFCRTHNIPFEAVRLDVKARQAETGQSLEDAARSLRYQCFDAVLPESARVATAHTLDDNLETTLIRMVRGTSPRGLSGIPAQRGRIIRPLLSVSRAQVLAFLDAEQVPYREDSTNGEDFCLRNRLRHHVLPLLRAENPNLAQSWLQTSRQLRQEDEYLSRLAADAMVPCTLEDGFSIAAAEALAPVLRRRVLFAFLTRFGVPAPRQKHLEQLQKLMRSDCPSGAVDLTGVRLERRYDLIHPAETGSEGFAPVPLPVPGSVRIEELGLTIRCEKPKNFSKITNTATTFTIKCDMIDADSLTVRPRNPGDRITLPGGSRSLKRLLIDRKIPARQRGRLAVIADCHGVAAVQLIGTDLSRIADGTSPCIQITIEKEENTP